MKRLYIRHVERMERDRRAQLVDQAIDAALAVLVAIAAGVIAVHLAN